MVQIYSQPRRMLIRFDANDSHRGPAVATWRKSAPLVDAVF